ncbi:MAG: chemotaxis protein CheA [Candidatus Zixiibacteriota bacterium]|nr:MAG: chemotaxis protein CheA [candidate division Zixibacteria bacterium]
MDEMQEIIDDFLVEADELIASLDNDLVTLESNPNDLELLNSIFRAAHTIKGTSSFLGLEQVTELTHKMEDILNRLRKAEMVVTPDIMDLLLESLDILKQLIQNVRDGNTEEVPIEDIVGRLVAGLTSQDGETGEEAPAPPPTASDTENSAQPEKTVPSAATKEKKPAAAAPAGGHKRSVEQTIRVDVNRLDTLMNLMGELVLGRNSLMQSVNTLSHDHEADREKLLQAAGAINYITTELQLAVMKMRMQPVGKVFNKFPRLVRDLARDTGKEIELIIEGEGTELDKSVIEEIGDPLVHLIRNSCDHGIEPPEEREAVGKPRKGTVRLTAAQEGSNIVIKITDDGRGLDVDAIRNKAIERGLVKAEDAARLPDSEVYRFIFEPGFSTAKKITDVSGRGVGMDVVRTNIEKLNGMIEITSKPGHGTTIAIKLPLTLAIIQGLLVATDGEVYVLPISSVYETVKSQDASVYYVNQKPVVRLRDDVIPLINLNAVLKGEGPDFQLAEKPYIVIVGLAEKRLGILIDRFLGQEEVVIKSLGEYLGSATGIAGATILGDGRIRLIVDMIGLFSLAKQRI